MVHMLSFSGGKDSTALLLMLLEKKMPLDYIVFVDLGKEFPQIYKHIDKVEKYIGREIIRLYADFEYYLAEYPTKKYGKGLGFPNSKVKRWCTGLKQKAISKFYREHNLNPREIVRYIGLAADEKKRIDKGKAQCKLNKYPLEEWGINEAQALEYCYSKGFDWDGLYKIVSRTGCYCCPRQSLKELKKIYRYFPDLWGDIKRLDSIPIDYKINFRTDYTLPQLETRFAQEIAQEETFMKWMLGEDKK